MEAYLKYREKLIEADEKEEEENKSADNEGDAAAKEGAIISFAEEPEYNFLDNGYTSPFTIDGIVYPSVEHYCLVRAKIERQAGKIEDKEIKDHILKTGSAKEAWEVAEKELNAKGKVEELNKLEEESAAEFVRKGVEAKFEQNAELKAKLLATKGREIKCESPRK